MADGASTRVNALVSALWAQWELATPRSMPVHALFLTDWTRQQCHSVDWLVWHSTTWYVSSCPSVLALVAEVSNANHVTVWVLCFILKVFLLLVSMHSSLLLQGCSEGPFVISPWSAPGDDLLQVKPLLFRSQGQVAKGGVVGDVLTMKAPVQEVANEVCHLQKC